MDIVLSPDYFTPDENKALARQLYRMAIQLNNAVKKNMDKKSVQQQSASSKSQQMTSKGRQSREIINEPQHEQERQSCTMSEIDPQKTLPSGSEASQTSPEVLLTEAYSRIIARLEELTGGKFEREDSTTSTRNRNGQPQNSATIHLVHPEKGPFREQEPGQHWPRR